MKTPLLICLLIAVLGVNAQVTADAGLDRAVCQNDTVTLVGTGLNPGDTGSYSWQDLSNLKNYIHTNPLQIAFSDTGVHYMQLKVVKTSAGLDYTDYDTLAVYVKALPNVNIELDDTLCASIPVQLKTKSSTNEGGTWTGMGVSGKSLDPSFSAQTKWIEGPFILRYRYTDTATACSASDTVSYRIQSTPSVEFQVPDTFRMCEGNLIQLNGTSLKYAQGSIWKTDGDGVFSTPMNLNTIYQHGLQDTAKGLVTLSLHSIKTGVCPAASDSFKLVLEAYPQFEISVNNPIQCEPALMHFKAIVQKPINTELQYTWWYGNGDSLYTGSVDSVQDVRYDKAINAFYKVSLEVSRRWGTGPAEHCTVRKDSNGLVRILPQPKADFYSKPSFYTSISKPEFQFTNTTTNIWGPGQVAYHWQFSNRWKDTSTSKNPFFRYKPDTGVFTVTLQASYNYFYKGIDYLCKDEVSKFVKIGPAIDCIKILDEQLLNRSIQVYFPFEGNFLLVDASGRTVISKAVNTSLQEDMDISDWPAGVYTFYISNGQEECARKFIKY